MDRQRRIAKIAQALIDQNLVDSNGETSDDDFKSVSVSLNSASETSESAEEGSKETTTETTVKTTAKERHEKDRDAKKKLQMQSEAKQAQKAASTREVLLQRLQKQPVREQFKLSDDGWTQHLAVTTVWNQLARERQATQLALDTLQYQEAAELQQQQQKFTESRPFYTRIESADLAHTMQVILELHFSQQAKAIMNALQASTSPEDFQATPEAKGLPEGCDYRYLYEAWMRAKSKRPIERRVLKVTAEQGKLMRFDAVDPSYARLPPQDGQLTGIQNVQQHLQQQLMAQFKQQQFIKSQQLQQQARPGGVQPAQQSLTAAQMYQMQLLQKQKEMLSQQKNSIYTTVHKTRPFQDQSSYTLLPNSKQTQTTLSYPEDVSYSASYIIVSDPPKKQFFGKFYALVDGKPQTHLMNVQLQTDIMAKMIRGNTIHHAKEDGDGATASIQVDGETFDLLKTDIRKLREVVLGCKELRILRGKGRAGRVLSDFMVMLRRERKDLYDLGDELFTAHRAKQQQEKEPQYKDGTWLTLDGMYLQAPGEYTVADVPQQEFQLSTNLLRYQVSNGHDAPGFIDRWFWAGGQKPAVKPVKKYTHPVTGEEYETLKEYQTIQKKLLEQQRKDTAAIEKGVRKAIGDTRQLLAQGKFEEADAEYKKAFSLLAAEFEEHNPVQPKQDESMVAKLLGSCRYRPLE